MNENSLEECFCRFDRIHEEFERRAANGEPPPTLADIDQLFGRQSQVRTMSALVDTANGGFLEEKGGGWKKIASAPRDGTIIDVWLNINPSPLSMGMGDSFGVPDAWFQDGKWVHMYRGKPTELERWYVTHWRPKKRVQGK